MKQGRRKGGVGMKRMKSKEVREESDSSSDTNSSLLRSDGSDYNEPEVEDETETESYSDESYGAIDKKKCPDNLDEVLSKSKAKPRTKAPTAKAPTTKATTAKGKRKVKVKLDPMVYMDNSKSEGGKIKEAGIVIASLNKKIKKKHKCLNLNCPVETLGRVMAKLGERQQQIVFEMGFDGLFHLAVEDGEGGARACPTSWHTGFVLELI